MNDLQIRELSEVVLPLLSEKDFARWYHQQGVRTVLHQGRYWKETVKGFYQPLHWLARLNTQEATCPVPLSWGFQATLCERDATAANGSLPVYLISKSEIESYDQVLSSKRRSSLKKYRKHVRTVELTGAALLKAQGYEVLLSALARTQHRKPPSKAAYLNSLAHYVAPGYRLILASLIGDKLVGYLTAYIVDGTAYLEETWITAEALPYNIGTGLTYEFVQLCRQSGKVREIVDGLHSRENPGLGTFKKEMGFPLKQIPTRVQILPIVESLIRWRYPHKYYRLTGRA